MTVRFETRGSGPGPVHTLPDDTPDVRRANPVDSLDWPDYVQNLTGERLAPRREDVGDGGARGQRGHQQNAGLRRAQPRHHHRPGVHQRPARPVAGPDVPAGHAGRQRHRHAVAGSAVARRRPPRRPRCPTPTASSTTPRAPAATQASSATASLPA